MGTGEIALPSLRWLLDNHSAEDDAPQFQVVGLFTQPDKKVGRKQILTPPEAKVLALENEIPVFQPERLRNNEEALEELRALDCDIAVVMAYGQILPNEVISAPKLACVNLHASLLPRHRGASPIQAAIREGDDETGITLMHIAAKLDAGDMILKKHIPILPDDTGGSLHDRLAELGPEVLAEGLPLLVSGKAQREKQDESQVTVVGKLAREDGEIDWTKSAEEIERLIRAYDPWPGTHTWFQTDDQSNKPRQLKIFPQTRIGPGTNDDPGSVDTSYGSLVVTCGGGSSLILEGHLQLEGRKRLPISDFLRGAPFSPETKFFKR